jgi:hypothetical protein
VSESKFKVGDRVSWLGLKGMVISTTESGNHPIAVEWDTKEALREYFTLDGRYWKGQRPSLKKLKKKKARYFYGAWEKCEIAPSRHQMHFVPIEPFVDLMQLTEMGNCWLRDCGTKKPKGAE